MFAFLRKYFPPSFSEVESRQLSSYEKYVCFLQPSSLESFIFLSSKCVSVSRVRKTEKWWEMKILENFRVALSTQHPTDNVRYYKMLEMCQRCERDERSRKSRGEMRKWTSHTENWVFLFFARLYFHTFIILVVNSAKTIFHKPDWGNFSHQHFVLKSCKFLSLCLKRFEYFILEVRKGVCGVRMKMKMEKSGKNLKTSGRASLSAIQMWVRCEAKKCISIREHENFILLEWHRRDEKRSQTLRREDEQNEGKSEF